MNRRLIRNLVVVFAALVVTGLARVPFDRALHAGLEKHGLLRKPIDLDTRQKLGQTGAAIALGGNRTLVATLLNIRAHVFWENQKWDQVEDQYRTIVVLQPRNRYYWEVASWHLAPNAYSDYIDKPEIPKQRRERLQREFFRRGMAFLEQGVKNNPEDWRLWATYAGANSQMWRPMDLDLAADCYKRSYELSGNQQVLRGYLYCVSRVDGREAEAWEVAKAVWAHPHNRQFISARTVYFVMQNWANPPEDERLSLEELYAQAHGMTAAELTPEQVRAVRRDALADFTDYWFRQHEKERYRVYGLEEVINELCREFEVPAEMHPLRHPPDKMVPDPRLESAENLEDRRNPWWRVWMNVYRPQLRSLLDRDAAS